MMMCTTVIGELSLLHRPITLSLPFIAAKNTNTTTKYTQILLQLTHMATKYTNTCSNVAHGKNCNIKVVFIDYYYYYFFLVGHVKALPLWQECMQRT